jgi:two-component system, chemotaxis family, CheB/CheR fusion protein
MRAKRVLIAEDNPNGAEMLRLVIATWGHFAEAMLDGHAAVQFAARFEPHVAIVEINLPVMNGYEAGRLLRNAHTDVLLIAMTGPAQVETRQRARLAGFHHHFVKPMDLTALKTLLSSDTLEHLRPDYPMAD